MDKSALEIMVVFNNCSKLLKNLFEKLKEFV